MFPLTLTYLWLLFLGQSQARNIPANVQELYDSVVAQGSCKKPLQTGFYDMPRSNDNSELYTLPPPLSPSTLPLRAFLVSSIYCHISYPLTQASSTVATTSRTTASSTCRAATGSWQTWTWTVTGPSRRTMMEGAATRTRLGAQRPCGGLSLRTRTASWT